MTCSSRSGLRKKRHRIQIDKLKRTALGVLAAIVAAFAFEALPSGLTSELAMKRIAGYFYVWPAIYGLPRVFVAMFVGAYVARSKGVVPAVILSVTGWSFAIHFLNQVAQAVGQHSLTDVAAMIANPFDRSNTFRVSGR